MLFCYYEILFRNNDNDKVPILRSSVQMSQRTRAIVIMKYYFENTKCYIRLNEIMFRINRFL